MCRKEHTGQSVMQKRKTPKKRRVSWGSTYRWELSCWMESALIK